MLLRLIKYFRGYVEVALWGYAPERFLNLCSNHNILIWDLRQEGDFYYIHISVTGQSHMGRPPKSWVFLNTI